MSKFALSVPTGGKARQGETSRRLSPFGGTAGERRSGNDFLVCHLNGAASFAIFDTFDTEAGRDAHLKGAVAAAFRAPEQANPFMRHC